jgi:hypothetical protein
MDRLARRPVAFVVQGSCKYTRHSKQLTARHSRRPVTGPSAVVPSSEATRVVSTSCFFPHPLRSLPCYGSHDQLWIFPNQHQSILTKTLLHTTIVCSARCGPLWAARDPVAMVVTHDAAGCRVPSFFGCRGTFRRTTTSASAGPAKVYSTIPFTRQPPRSWSGDI